MTAPNKEIKAEKPKRANFQKPTVEEVTAYCQERGNGIDAKTFVDFYAARGWMLGKNHMKDWRAAVRTWEQRSQSAVLNSNRPVMPSIEELQKREGEL